MVIGSPIGHSQLAPKPPKEKDTIRLPLAVSSKLRHPIRAVPTAHPPASFNVFVEKSVAGTALRNLHAHGVNSLFKYRAE